VLPKISSSYFRSLEDVINSKKRPLKSFALTKFFYGHGKISVQPE